MGDRGDLYSLKMDRKYLHCLHVGGDPGFDWSKGSEGMVLGGDNSTYFDSKRPTSP